MSITNIKIMESITLNLSTIKELGANAAVVLAVVNQSKEKMSNTDVARIVGISFPTAQKILHDLAEKGLIQSCAKMYCKI